MENEIIPYLEMCRREGVSLQQGMNFQLGDGYSVILMSVRLNAPYRDEISDDGTTLIYEGHDLPRRNPLIDPKTVDQPQFTSAGRLTQNGKFYKAAEDFRNGIRKPEIVRFMRRFDLAFGRTTDFSIWLILGKKMMGLGMSSSSS